IFYELDKIRALPVPEPELADARNYVSGVFSMDLATQDGLLSQLATVALNELPDHYLDTYREKVRALTPQDPVSRGGNRFAPANIQVVVVGERPQIEPQAALFGELD